MDGAQAYYRGGTGSGQLDEATKRTRLAEIAELTDAPSAVHRHMEAYPHAFSKKRYAEYLAALHAYRKDLGA